MEVGKVQSRSNKQSFKSVDILGRNINGLPRIEIKDDILFNWIKFREHPKSGDPFEICPSRHAETLTNQIVGLGKKILESENLQRVRSVLLDLFKDDIVGNLKINSKFRQRFGQANSSDIVNLINNGEAAYYETPHEAKLVFNLYPERLESSSVGKTQ